MSIKITTILFDLDETLSDHSYSLEHALTVLRPRYAVFSPHTTAVLMTWYQEALDEAFAEYLAHKITHGENTRHKIRLFFKKMGETLSESQIDSFLELYREAYSQDRRATLGTVKTLEVLREHGYKIGVVTNGQEKIQQTKLAEIKIHHLIDELIVSETVGFSKPAQEIFSVALKKMGSTNEETLMVGDNIQKDIEGAIKSGIQPILFSLNPKESEIMVMSVRVPVIKEMTQLLTYLNID